MYRVEATWTWHLESVLHCGTGVSRPGTADHLAFSEPNPASAPPNSLETVIPGDATKGAVRMAAEQLAVWLRPAPPRTTTTDTSNDEAPVRPAALPGSRVFAVTFGDAGLLCHFTPGQVASNTPKLLTVASTAIDRDTGVAREDALRTVQAVAPGLDITAHATVIAPTQDDARLAETLLVAGIASAEHVGAKAGIGWGHMRLTRLDVTTDKVPVNVSDAVSPERLEQLNDALAAKEPVAAWTWHHVPTTTTAASEASSESNWAWYRLSIQLLEPASFPTEPDVGNTTQTDDAIRATTLRGALATYWARSGRSRDEIMRWLSEQSKWSPAFPYVGSHRALPTPASLLTEKRADEGEREIVDALVPRDPHQPEAHDRRLVKVKSPWLHQENGQYALTDFLTRRQVRMHVARDYFTGSKLDGALYARQEISATERPRFEAWIKVERKAFEGVDSFDIYLGRRKSAGSGLAKVNVHFVPEGPDFNHGATTHQDYVFVQLLSPAIVRNPYGHPRRSLSPADWQELTACQVEAVSDQGSASRARAGRRGGWMSPWGHARAAVATIEAGSAWRLRSPDPSSLRAKLLELRQIGERQHEGFGWLLVDPPFLGRQGAVGTARSPTANPQSPHRWPGCEALTVDTLSTVIAALPSTLPHTLTGPLQTLAARVREITSPRDVAQVREFYDERRTRDKAGEWEPLRAGRAHELIDQSWHDIDRLRFTIEALIVRASLARQGDGDGN